MYPACQKNISEPPLWCLLLAKLAGSAERSASSSWPEPFSPPSTRCSGGVRHAVASPRPLTHSSYLLASNPGLSFFKSFFGCLFFMFVSLFSAMGVLHQWRCSVEQMPVLVLPCEALRAVFRSSPVGERCHFTARASRAHCRAGDSPQVTEMGQNCQRRGAESILLQRPG